MRLRPGAVPIDEVREDIKAVVLEENQGERFDQTVLSWREASEITIYTENMAYSA